MFGLAHALSFDDAWHVDFDWIALVLVTSVALILAYVAELTGSILMTILFHNIFNVIGHGWQMAAGR